MYMYIKRISVPPGLLQHVEYVRASEEPEEYPVVEWFAHPTPPPPDPEKEPYRSPLDKSWMTWTIPDHLPRLGPSQTTAPAARSRHSHPPPSHTKLPPLCVHTDTPLPPSVDHTHLCRLDERVEFDRLLSMDYQKEWLIERKAKEEQVLRKAKVPLPSSPIPHSVLAGCRRSGEPGARRCWSTQ